MAVKTGLHAPASAKVCGGELNPYGSKHCGRTAITPCLMIGLGVQLTHIVRAVRTSGLHKAAEKRNSMAVERAGHKRSSSASRDSGLHPQVR